MSRPTSLASRGLGTKVEPVVVSKCPFLSYSIFLRCYSSSSCVICFKNWIKGLLPFLMSAAVCGLPSGKCQLCLSTCRNYIVWWGTGNFRWFLLDSFHPRLFGIWCHPLRCGCRRCRCRWVRRASWGSECGSSLSHFPSPRDARVLRTSWPWGCLREGASTLPNLGVLVVWVHLGGVIRQHRLLR